MEVALPVVSEVSVQKLEGASVLPIDFSRRFGRSMSFRIQRQTEDRCLFLAVAVGSLFNEGIQKGSGGGKVWLVGRSKHAVRKRKCTQGADRRRLANGFEKLPSVGRYLHQRFLPPLRIPFTKLEIDPNSNQTLAGIAGIPDLSTSDSSDGCRRRDAEIGIAKTRMVQDVGKCGLKPHRSSFIDSEALESAQIHGLPIGTDDDPRPVLPNRPLGGTAKADASNQRSIDRWLSGKLPLAIRSGTPPKTWVLEGSDPANVGVKNSPV